MKQRQYFSWDLFRTPSWCRGRLVWKVELVELRAFVRWLTINLSSEISEMFNLYIAKLHNKLHFCSKICVIRMFYCILWHYDRITQQIDISMRMKLKHAIFTFHTYGFLAFTWLFYDHCKRQSIVTAGTLKIITRCSFLFLFF